MGPKDRTRIALAAAAILLASFFVGGAALAWRVREVDLALLPTLPVLKAAAAIADLGWRFWGH